MRQHPIAAIVANVAIGRDGRRTCEKRPIAAAAVIAMISSNIIRVRPKAWWRGPSSPSPTVRIPVESRNAPIPPASRARYPRRTPFFRALARLRV
jgi:hypothetical protein